MAGNSFGTLFRFTSWGESHGPAIGCVVDGTPPRLPLSEADIQVWMEKRRPGQSRFVTQRQEPDTVKILSGVFEGVTTGTPIALHIDNVDQRSRDYSEIKDKFRPVPRRLHLLQEIRRARLSRRRPAVGARDRRARRRGRHRPQDPGRRRQHPRRRGAARHPEDRPRQMGLVRHRRQSRSGVPTARPRRAGRAISTTCASAAARAAR